MEALVFDFETTGLNLHPNARVALQPRAIEFAGLLIDADGEEHGELSFLCHPGKQITVEITKITGITNEDLASAHPFSRWLPRLRELFAAADILVAHNLPFDHDIMSRELATAHALEDWPWPKHNLCTAQLHEPLWGRRPRLVELYESVVGTKYVQTHRALDDVRALARIVHERQLISLVASMPKIANTGFPTGFRADQRGAT